MNVLLINGSPHENGCTFTALSEVADQLKKNGLETHIFHIGADPIADCTGCGECTESSQCVFDSDRVNQCIGLLREADGLVVGSPVYFAGPSGGICSFLNRLFFLKYGAYANKPAASVVVCRRGGATAALDRLNKYFAIAHMPIVSSQYWAVVHGTTPGEALQDHEGMQTMRALGRNMAWLIRSIQAAKENVSPPKHEAKIRTNFIR